jgi:predicted MFS family arabinose efflux permease
LVAKIGVRPVLLFGLTDLLVATLWISRVTPSSGYFASLFGPLLMFGLGAGSCFLPLSVTILAGVPRGDAGAASGMLQTMQQTGVALGVAALSSVVAADGLRDALLCGTGIIAVALVLAVVFIRPPSLRVPVGAEQVAEAIEPLLLTE